MPKGGSGSKSDGIRTTRSLNVHFVGLMDNCFGLVSGREALQLDRVVGPRTRAMTSKSVEEAREGCDEVKETRQIWDLIYARGPEGVDMRSELLEMGEWFESGM